MNFTKNIVFKNFTLELHDEGYYEITMEDDGVFGFEELDLLVAAQKIFGEKKLPVIVMCGEYSSTDIEFIKHLAKNENDPYSKADAFVLKSIAQRLMANFYIKIVVPERPTKFFNKRTDAYQWIKQFME
ncbi:MAG: hypothetical protein V4580_15590 [Bacteroidota bacterium]